MIVIPAKYSSSRAPKKNFRVFYNGFSLLQIAILRCVKADCGPVVISSEKPQMVLEQLESLGDAIYTKVVVHERPAELARDPATILDVLENVLNSELIPQGGKKIAVVLPTSPFNTWQHIRKAFKLSIQNDAEKVLSVSKSFKPPFNAWIDAPSGTKGEIVHAFPESPYRLMQSTRCPEAYLSNGCISIYSQEKILGDKRFDTTVAYKMSEISALDIDHEFEFEFAKFAFSKWAEDAVIFCK